MYLPSSSPLANPTAARSGYRRRSAGQPTRNWSRFAFLGELVLERLGNEVRDQSFRRAAQLDDFLDQAGAEETIVQASDEANHLDLRRELPIHQRHLRFDLEIGHRPQSTNDDFGLDFAGKSHEEPAER